MVRHYSVETFRVMNANNEGFVCECYTTNTRNGFCHTCKVEGLTDTKISYLNRTWERYQYESVLINAIKKYNKVYKTHLTIGDVER